jgi:hypothetical protein
MRKYWPTPEAPTDTVEQVLARRTLAMVFNHVVGKPSTDGLITQTAFIAGTLSLGEATAYVRYAEQMIVLCSNGATS